MKYVAYVVSGELPDAKIGPHYAVQGVTPRGAKKVVHRYKGQDTAEEVATVLNKFVGREY